MKSSRSYPPFLYLFTILLAILPLARAESLLDTTSLPRFALIAVINLALLVIAVRSRARPTMARPLALVILVFVIAQGVSVLSASNISEAYAAFMRYGVVLSYLFLALHFFSHSDFSLRVLLSGALFFAFFSAVPSFFQLLKSLGSGDFFADIYSITGTFSHKNLLASALMLILPFCFMAAALFRGWPQKLAAALAVLCLIEIFVLRTRGVWLGVVGAAVLTGLVFALQRPRNVRFPRRWVAALGGLSLIILVGLFASPQIKAGFTNFSNVDKRLAFWHNSAEMIKDHPLLGVGAGNWKLIFPKYGLSEVDHSTMQGITHIQRPHNDFIWVWAEAGPLALLAYLALFGLPLWRIWHNLKNNPGRESQVVNYFALFGLLSYFIFSFGDFPLERAPHSVLFFTLIALAYRGPIKSTSAFELKSYWLYVLMAVQILALLLVTSRWQSEVATQKVLQANARKDAQAIVPAVEAALTPYYNVDVYANPLRYYSGLGLSFGKRPDEALLHLREARRHAPYNILVYNAFANTYARKGQAELAIAYLDSALHISPRYEMARLLKAELLLEQNLPVPALETLNGFPPENTTQRYQIALARALRGSLETYDQHGRFAPMMEHLRAQPRLEQPLDYVRAYRQKRRVD